MTSRSNRALKKLHRRWLEIGVIDASQNALWRKRLFASNVSDIFTISANDTSGLPEAVAAAVRRYKLHFSVRKAESSEAEPWLSEGGAVIFKFWATAYPTVFAYTGNNPSVIRAMPNPSFERTCRIKPRQVAQFERWAP